MQLLKLLLLQTLCNQFGQQDRAPFLKMGIITYPVWKTNKFPGAPT